jgi:hypothetical protein
MWATPLWGFIGLWAITRFPIKFSPAMWRRFTYSWAALFTIIISIYAIINVYSPYVTHKSLRVYFPGQTLAKLVIKGWDQHYHVPLRYIIGDTWPAGNVAYYPPGRQHVLIDGDYQISPWVKPTDIKEYGAVLVWCIQNCAGKNSIEPTPTYVQNFPDAEIQEPLVIPRQSHANLPPVTIGWALLPPFSDRKNSLGEIKNLPPTL